MSMNRNYIEDVKRMSVADRCALFTGASGSRTKEFEESGVRSICMTDGPNGIRGDVADCGTGHTKSLCYPSACLLACSFDRDILNTVGYYLGLDARSRGVDLVLGPAINLKRYPLCGRNFEYYSEDPCLTGELAGAFVAGIQRTTGACVKHFAVNNRENKRMSLNCIVDRCTLQETYLSSFARIVKKYRPDAIMTSYNKINGEYAGENRYSLKKVLRRDWQYDGLVISDWGAVNNIVDSIRCGLDLEMPVNDSNTEILKKSVYSGEFPEEELNAHTADLLRRLDGICGRRKDVRFDQEEAYNKLADIVAECSVLLKNEGKILPLKGKKRIGVFGELAIKPRIQGGGCANVQAYGAEDVFTAVRLRFQHCECEFSLGFAEGKNGKQAEKLVSDALAVAQNSDVCIVAMGLPESLESEGYDRKSLKVPGWQIRFLKALYQVNKNIVVMLYNGGMVCLDFEKYAKAVVECYLGGSATGAAAAKILSGDVPPAGRLAETAVRKAEDFSCCPYVAENPDVEIYGEGLFVGYKFYNSRNMKVIYPFGYGLHYGEVKYSEVEITDKKIRIHLVNTSDYDVKETVQIYVNFLDCSYARPGAELKEFRKVLVPKGGERYVEIALNSDCFEVYDYNTDSMTDYSGKAEISVRKNAREIIANRLLTIPGEKRKHYDRNTLIGELLKTPEGIEIIENKLKQYLIKAILGNFNADYLSMKNGRAIGHERFNSMMENMPLRALVNLSSGAFSNEMLNEVLEHLRESDVHG